MSGRLALASTRVLASFASCRLRMLVFNPGQLPRVTAHSHMASPGFQSYIKSNYHYIITTIIPVHAHQHGHGIDLPTGVAA